MKSFARQAKANEHWGEWCWHACVLEVSICLQQGEKTGMGELGGRGNRSGCNYPSEKLWWSGLRKWEWEEVDSRIEKVFFIQG